VAAESHGVDRRVFDLLLARFPGEDVDVAGGVRVAEGGVGDEESFTAMTPASAEMAPEAASV
jgi:hypothetical protein